MASTVSGSEVTAKIPPIQRVDPVARLVDALSEAAVWAPEVGTDIADAIYKLLASAERRKIEHLPDITKEAEAA